MHLSLPSASIGAEADRKSNKGDNREPAKALEKEESGVAGAAIAPV